MFRSDSSICARRAVLAAARPPRAIALCMAAALLALLTAVAALPAAADDVDQPTKMVVLGFDGVDADLTAQWLDAGELPNLAKLRDQGTFSPLMPTIPSQTPVSWSTFSTGLNPGRHAIFDFLKRDPETYIPGFAAFEETKEPFLWGERTPLVLGLGLGVALRRVLVALLTLVRMRPGLAVAIATVLAIAGGAGSYVAAGQFLPVEQPSVIHAQQGDTFWELLGQAGKRAMVFRVPVTFPPQPFANGKLVSGLGTPDLSLRIGKPFYFTSELFFQPAAGGSFSVEVVELIDNRGVIPTEIRGPRNALFPDGPDYIKIPMTLTVADDHRSLTIEVSGSTVTLEPGEWSEWVSFKFPFNPVIARAMIRSIPSRRPFAVST
ncbi:MAG: alkaline phosphatase family protein [Acidobacteriota bacterium]